MCCTRLLIIALLALQAIAGASIAGGRGSSYDRAVGVGNRNAKAAFVNPLDRVAIAVDGAESSYGKDMMMWRPDPSGPQGPMQVSEAAAADVGGGDRFDLGQNRTLGRAYLAQLYRRYKNWPDAIAAYNWGVGKMDAWIKAGRPPEKFLAGVAVYLQRVLHQSGLCDGPETIRDHSRETEISGEGAQLPPETSACTVLGNWGGPSRPDLASSRFLRRLDQAMQLALQRAAQARP